jgi:predicted signal transduction protein with EAL and GGDEF domain
VLGGLLLLAPAVAGCSLSGASGPTQPDPLIALADAARADAALAAAAVAADRGLAEVLQPLVDARTQHAAALDAEIARLDPDRPTPAPPATPTPSTTRAGRAEVQRAVLASGRAASEVALGLPPERIGLVASVAACCGAYAEVLA